MAQLEVLEDAAVLIGDDGRIDGVGPYREVRARAPGALIEEIDGVLFPGFVDAHTHGVFGAVRTADHERRAKGESYQAIAAAGGGILSTVRDVRARSLADLTDLPDAASPTCWHSARQRLRSSRGTACRSKRSSSNCR
jgi:imidazolonepropionase